MGSKNIDQKEDAINTIDQNLQIVACAGSGKTHTIVKRIINILDKKRDGVCPGNIVAFTFTDKAAKELKERIYKEYYDKFGNYKGLAEMYVGTIHGFCLRLLQHYNPKYLKYTLLNETQTKIFIKKTYDDNGMSDIIYTAQNGRKSHLDRNRDVSVFVDFINKLREQDLPELSQEHKAILEKYNKVLHDNCYLDYSAVICEAVELLSDDKVASEISTKIKYITIDEYQDTNPLQENLFYKLYELGANICVVGDDDQLIYHWRGSDITYIKDFKDRYNHVKICKLLQNYRSSEGIVDVAYTVIKHNRNRIPKEMKSAGKQKYSEGDIVGALFEKRDDEINFIIQKIKELQGVKFIDKEVEYALSYGDIAILVYSTKKIDKLLQELDNHGIPYIVENTNNLFSTEEVMASVNIYKYLNNKLTSDPNYCCTKEELKIPWENIANGIFKNNIDSAIDYLDMMDPTKFMNPWEKFNLQEIYRGFLGKLGVFSKKYENKDRFLYNLASFTQCIYDYELVNLKTSPDHKLKGFVGFLKYDAINIYPEGWLNPAFREDLDQVKIMTYFQAKGLQFPIVFMPFLTVNSYFPPKKGGGKQSNNLLKEYGCADKFENNEESYRRVYYVGVTRSKKYLYMTQSPEFYGNGKQYKKPAPAFKEALHSDYVLQNADYKPEYDRVQKNREESSESYVVDFSTLKDYYICPYKFKISSIYGFREPLDYRMGHGKSLHNILNEIHTKHKKGEEYDVEEIIERQYHLPYAPPKLTEDMKKTAYEEVTAYIENNKDSFDDIELIEEYIEFKTSDGNIDIFINGRIDLVKNTKDGKIKVVDFKSDKNTLPRKLEKEQLMIYALGYLHLRGKMPDAVESYHLKEKHPIIEYPSPEKLKKVEDNIHEIIKNIKKNNFKKAIETKGEEVCKSIDCPYLNECKKQYIQ